MKKIIVLAIIISFGLIVSSFFGVTGNMPDMGSFSSGWLSGISAFSQGIQWPWHMRDYGYGEGMMGGCWFGGFIVWIIIIVVIALLVYFIIRSKRSVGPESPFQGTPLDILKKRYAKGEITKEEFDEIRKDMD